MNKILEVYKGTDKDMKCHGGYQYEIDRKETASGAIRCGGKGFHSCEAPFDVLRYFPLRNGNRYFKAEAGGMIDRTNARDSKIASSELKIKTEIGIAGLVKAQIEFTKRKAKSGENGGSSSNLAGGYGSNLAGGNGSNLAGGDNSLIIGRNGCKAKGGKNSVIVLTEWNQKDDEYIPVCVKAEIVDGERIKADTWYELKDGEFKECREEE